MSASDVPHAWTDPEALTEYTQAEYDAFTELLNSPDTPASAVRYAATSMAVALSVTAENGTPANHSRRNAARVLRRVRRGLDSFTTQEDPV